MSRNNQSNQDQGGQRGGQNQQPRQQQGRGQAQRQQPRAGHGQGSAPQQQRPSSSLDVLFSNEEVLIDTRPAWTAWAAHLVVAVLIFLFSLITGETGAIAGAFIISAVIVGYVWYQRRKVRYVVTQHRVMVIVGVAGKKTNEAWMDDIKGMQTGASLLERLLGHGHITVSRDILSRGSLLPGSVFGAFKGMTLGGISNHEEVATVIRERQAEQRSLTTAPNQG